MFFCEIGCGDEQEEGGCQVEKDGGGDPEDFGGVDEGDFGVAHLFEEE